MDAYNSETKKRDGGESENRESENRGIEKYGDATNEEERDDEEQIKESEVQLISDTIEVSNTGMPLRLLLSRNGFNCYGEQVVQDGGFFSVFRQL